ncbi:MAG: YqiA/YcfP family alpha/beta fold hydrolase [Burkholderiales bacterium]
MIAYLHGFNSSPESHKAQVLGAYLSAQGRADRYACPALPPLADRAIAGVESLMAGHAGAGRWSFVGSSLGGFYATYLAEKHGARAVLLNPAIDPHVGLRAYLGEQRNLHTGEPYQLTEAHLRAWDALWVPAVHPERYLLIVETGDEVLDYRKALERYRGAEQIVVDGGDHSLQSFERHLPRILEFAEG